MAQHDHALHIPEKFIRGEARRASWLSKDKLVDLINEYKGILTSIGNKYDTDFEIVAPDRTEAMEQTYVDRFEPVYRNITDYLLIYSHLCSDLYADDEQCNLPDETWKNKYDRRGDDFHKEYLEEITRVIHNEMHDIKQAIRMKGMRPNDDL